MKVLAFSDHLSTGSGGGAERVAAEVYGRLVAEADIDLTVVSVIRPGHQPVTIPGVKVVAFAGNDLSGVVGAELLLSRGLGRQVRRLHRQVRPDVIHANGLHFQGSIVAARLARRTGTPLVTTAHLGDLSALSPKLRIGGTVWDQTFGRYVVGASTTMVAVSSAVAEHVSTLGADNSGTVVALNGVDHGVYHTRGRRPVGDQSPLRAVFIGRLIDNKGPHIALDGLARARAAGADVTLDVLGDGPIRDRLHDLAVEHNLGAAVTFAGHVDDIAGRLRQADVLLRPSYTEGLPLAVLEAMACGVPVICSTVPGNTEIVAHDVNGWHTTPGSGQDVAAALIALAADRDRLRRLASTATATAAHYTWERSTDIHAGALRAA